MPSNSINPTMRTRVQPTGRLSRKYDSEILAASRRAQELRGDRRAISPVTVMRVRQALDGMDPMAAIDGMSIRQAKRYAAGDRNLTVPAHTEEIYKTIKDPFARGRGFVAACIALAGK